MGALLRQLRRDPVRDRGFSAVVPSSFAPSPVPQSGRVGRVEWKWKIHHSAARRHFCAADLVFSAPLPNRWANWSHPGLVAPARLPDHVPSRSRLCETRPAGDRVFSFGSVGQTPIPISSVSREAEKDIKHTMIQNIWFRSPRMAPSRCFTWSLEVEPHVAGCLGIVPPPTRRAKRLG